MVFCDTSTLAKYYVPEAESRAVRTRLDREPQILASELARAELMAVFHRRLREGSWKRSEFLAVIRQFAKDDHGNLWTWIPIDSDLMERVTRTYDTLSDAVFLRTSDCIHLVTAVRSGADKIHTHDRHQALAAPVFGLTPVAIR